MAISLELTDLHADKKMSTISSNTGEKRRTKRPRPICHLISNLGEKLYAWHLLSFKKKKAKHLNLLQAQQKRYDYNLSLPPCLHRMAYSTCEGSLKMGPICGVYFKLSVATKRVCVRQAVQEMFTSSTQKPAAAVCCNKWIPVGHVSQGNTQKQCLYAIAPSQQLMQPGLSRKALLYNTHSTGGIWIVLIQYRQARSDGSFRAMCTLYGAIQSSKICRQHQITKREHWLCSGTICYHCVLPELVICQWERSRWMEALRWSPCHNSIVGFIQKVKKDSETLNKSN